MILNIYPYGSRVYGTAEAYSDTDLILVTDFSHDQESQHDWPKIDLTIWTAATFQRLLDAHDPSALECHFLPSDLKICSRHFDFKLDLEKLRRSFSAKSSNSWVKAKKKIDLHHEYNLGMKSLFHSIRLLSFGIQIARFHDIIGYNEVNSVWEKIKEQDFRTWNEYKEYWQPYYNQLRTEFRLTAPLPKGEEK
jgi:predicted nucleotidyltransferase